MTDVGHKSQRRSFFANILGPKVFVYCKRYCYIYLRKRFLSIELLLLVMGRRNDLTGSSHSVTEHQEVTDNDRGGFFHRFFTALSRFLFSKQSKVAVENETNEEIQVQPEPVRIESQQEFASRVLRELKNAEMITQ